MTKIINFLRSNFFLGMVLCGECFALRKVGLEFGIIAFLCSCIATTIIVDRLRYESKYNVKLLGFNILQCIVFVITASIVNLGLVRIITTIFFIALMSISKKILFYGEELKAMTYTEVVLYLAGMIIFVQYWCSQIRGWIHGNAVK